MKGFPGAWGACWISSAVATVIGGSLAFVRPFEGATMNLLVGLIPLAIFLAFMVGGPLVAAFRIQREQEESRRKEREEHTRQQEANSAEIAKLRSELDTRAKRKADKEELGRFMEEGQELLTKAREPSLDPPETETWRWSMEVEVYLRQELDSSYIPRFHSQVELPPQTPLGVSIVSDKQRAVLQDLHTKLSRLHEFIVELSRE
jgi:cell division protein FtsB